MSPKTRKMMLPTLKPKGNSLSKDTLTSRMGDSDKKNVEIKMYNMKVMKSIYQASESDTADHVYDDLIVTSIYSLTDIFRKV